MKITDIKIYPTWVGSRNQFIVKVETDEGIYRLYYIVCGIGINMKDYPIYFEYCT